MALTTSEINAKIAALSQIADVFDLFEDELKKRFYEFNGLAADITDDNEKTLCENISSRIQLCLLTSILHFELIRILPDIKDDQKEKYLNSLAPDQEATQSIRDHLIFIHLKKALITAPNKDRLTDSVEKITKILGDIVKLYMKIENI